MPRLDSKRNVHYRLVWGETRVERSEYIFANGDVSEGTLTRGIQYYEVASQTHERGTLRNYAVLWYIGSSLATCNCADYRFRQIDECKHILAVELYRLAQ